MGADGESKKHFYKIKGQGFHEIDASRTLDEVRTDIGKLLT